MSTNVTFSGVRFICTFILIINPPLLRSLIKGVGDSSSNLTLGSLLLFFKELETVFLHGKNFQHRFQIF